jgi:hypothetical protein
MYTPGRSIPDDKFLKYALTLFPAIYPVCVNKYKNIDKAKL